MRYRKRRTTQILGTKGVAEEEEEETIPKLDSQKTSHNSEEEAKMKKI